MGGSIEKLCAQHRGTLQDFTVLHICFIEQKYDKKGEQEKKAE